MADPQDLHQIEYRHHQTRDLSPVATSMPSPESLRAWDSRIRAWVRHPHADSLSESVCYQVLSNGQAAMAWRYWDRRVVERADGTQGRPLVSRVLVGQASVLTPDVAVALCLTGLPDSVGPLPGEVPDGGQLPTVRGDALNAITRDKTPELDQDAVKQAGLQAVVAAALADPATPLAISLRDVVIQKPLRDGVQYPLLWGLRRIAGPLLGPLGRGWSFSTFEPPLGEMDPTSLPGIVFRQAQDGMQAPPIRWRREVKVRPFALDALDPGLPYADQVELAGCLVARYQERGGDGLQRFIVECCGSERSLQVRLNRVLDQLRDTESPVIICPDSVRFVSLSDGSAPARQEPEPAEPDLGGPDLGEPKRDVAAADEGSRDVAGEPSGPETREPDPDFWETDDEARESDNAVADGAYEDGAYEDGAWPQAEAAIPQDVAPGLVPSHGETVVSGTRDAAHRGYQEPRRDGFQSPAGADEQPGSLAPSKEGQPVSPLTEPERSGQQAGARSMAYPAERRPSPPQVGTVSRLLKQLELVANDTGQFDSILQSIFQAGHQADDLNDRAKSWEVISDSDWYNNIYKQCEIYVEELAEIFGIVVIPDLVGPRAAEVIVTWAYDAPPAMVGGLLLAARKANSETWQAVMQILEPVLALRWAIDSSIQNQWDASRAMRSITELGSGDNKRGVLGRFRRH